MELSMIDRGISVKRMPIIDISRFYGMILVYYGHIVEQVMYLGSAAAAVHYKFIYSFHMPLFFLLSGTIVTEKKLALPFGQFFKRTVAARLVPYILFSVLLGIVSFIIPGWHPLGELTNSSAYFKGVSSTLKGLPAFCIPLWFMALLVSVEFFHYFVSKLVKNSSALAILATILYVGGYYLNDAYFFMAKGKAFWFINEVPVVYCFYVAGILITKSGWLERDISKLWSGIGALFCLVLIAVTFDLNTGPFRALQAVVIAASGHGNIFLFPLTAFLGSIFILLAARSVPEWRWLSYMGKNALSLFCMNGIFYHFVNPVVAKWFSGAFEISHTTVFIYTAVLTVISLSLCVPLVYLFTTYLPQFMGKPTQDGPVCKPLISDMAVR
jgi:acyltransferase